MRYLTLQCVYEQIYIKKKFTELVIGKQRRRVRDRINFKFIRIELKIIKLLF